MSKPPMSPKRRFLTAMMGGSVDRVPVGNVVSVITVELMEIAQAWFPEAHLNSEAMTRLAAASYEVLGYDTVMPIASVTQEASALGCDVEWGTPELMPSVKTHPFAEMQDLLIVERWIEAPAIQVVLDALGLLRKAYGERVVIVGKVMGPWTLSYHMMGVEDFLVSTLQEPARAQRSLDILKSVTIDFAIAQMKAGADVICLADHATGGMVSPDMYRDMLLPIHQEIIAEIGCPTVLHCCGNTTDRLRYFVETGVDCYHFESQVNVEEAVSIAAGEMTLIGNINNPELLLSGTPEQVANACHHAIRGGVQILSPECAVPLTTPIENLQTLVDVAEGKL
ncbi:MAG TPA: MtaA/CmuA family methyltransferase [Anaerolineae bacterium]|nr:MtaA/CmuA family methyltransferase [Anaerolineae bacterium]